MSWRPIGAINGRCDWVANALGLNLVDPNISIEDGDFARDGLHLSGREKRRLGQLYARVSGTDVRVKCDIFWKMEIQNEGYQGKATIIDRRTEDFT